MPGIFFSNVDMPEPTSQYVAWIDLMGTESAMSRSLKISATMMFKFHVAIAEALEAQYGDLSVYPLMDGAYVCASRQRDILAFMRTLFARVADDFLTSSNPLYRFIPRGAIAFGPIVHGATIPASSSFTLANKTGYKGALIVGVPMVQANSAEQFAPPFGIAVHESARAFSPHGESPFHHVWWTWKDSTSAPLWEPLRIALCEHYACLEQAPNRMLYPFDAIQKHKKMVNEYFFDLAL